MNSQIFDRQHLDGLARAAITAPFCPDLLEVCPPLWGSFWQGDVVSPGYTLPAIELAFLRAVRLDETWPGESSLSQFLSDLKAVVNHPQADVWTGLEGGYDWVVFVRNDAHSPFLTVVWYCPTTNYLHAGYHTTLDRLNLGSLMVHRKRDSNIIGQRRSGSSAWLGEAAQFQPSHSSLAQTLDQFILKVRAGAL